MNVPETLSNWQVGVFWLEGMRTAMSVTSNSSNYHKPRLTVVRVPVTCTLERLPHLAARVEALWGHADFEPYVGRLIMESRDGQRQGLPWDVAQELFFLVELSIAKRALAAAELTGAPFKDMFAQCLKRSAGVDPSGPRMTDRWSDPAANKEVGRMGRSKDTSRRATSNANHRQPSPPGWWRRLLA
jgi:hypothetical protein